MNKNLGKITYFPLSDIKNVASKHISVFKTRVTNKGLDYKGKQLPGYSDGYREALERDMRIKRGPRKGQRHKGLQGVSITTNGRKIANRQFHLRGLTMGPGFGVRKVATDHYVLGWDGEAAMIVDYHASKKRNVIDDIPGDEYDYIIAMLGKSIDKQWAKVNNIKINVG